MPNLYKSCKIYMICRFGYIIIEVQLQIMASCMRVSKFRLHNYGWCCIISDFWALLLLRRQNVSTQLVVPNEVIASPVSCHLLSQLLSSHEVLGSCLMSSVVSSVSSSNLLVRALALLFLQCATSHVLGRHRVRHYCFCSEFVIAALSLRLQGVF